MDPGVATYDRSETNAWRASASYCFFFSTSTGGEITTTQGTEDMSKFSLISAGGGFGFGLFRLGGSYRRGVSERKFASRITENGIEVPGMQLVAFRRRGPAGCDTRGRPARVPPARVRFPSRATGSGKDAHPGAGDGPARERRMDQPPGLRLPTCAALP